jgi:hypothetical protein
VLPCSTLFALVTPMEGDTTCDDKGDEAEEDEDRIDDRDGDSGVDDIDGAVDDRSDDTVV